MIRVLIVDDSKVIQEFLSHLLNYDPEIMVIGIANSGNEAIELVRILEPDVITMDIHMPGLNGYETTKRIMETFPIPIVIVSGSPTIKEDANVFRSLEAGALAVVHRPPGFEHPLYSDLRKELIQTVKQMSKVKITTLPPINKRAQNESGEFAKPFEKYLRRIQIVAIGASIGGPIAIQKILCKLPADLPVPVLIVQHISAGFAKTFMNWLSLTSGIKLKLAEHGETILAGVGYIAPDHFQMGITSENKINLSDGAPENESKPSVGFLFRSVAETFWMNALGVLLSGMGNDGAEALKVMKDKGALTIVQNEESSVVFSMPGEALRIGAAELSFSPERIAEIIAKSGSKK
jgi:two-component system, chemotaxis family, protein-glutamate methylesterase/glutaminase